MKKLRLIWLYCLLATLLLAVLVSCERGGVPLSQEPKTSDVCLALRVGAFPQTKADVSTIAELKPTGASFRGLDKVYVIPFSGSGVIPTSEPLSLPLELPGFLPAGEYNANAHLYKMHQAIPKGTELVLAYGKGLTQEQSNEVKTKQIYGSLKEEAGFNGSAASTAADFRFSPEPMYGSATDLPTEALTIARALSTIVNGSSFTITAYYDNGKSKDVTIPWSGNLRDNNLSDCYLQLTAEGRLLPGSGASVSVLLTTLYKALQLKSIDEVQYQLEVDGQTYDATKIVDSAESPLLYKDLFNGLRQVILDKMEIDLSDDLSIDADEHTVAFKDEKVQGYPENRGLPSGAATVRWSPTGYVVPLQNGLDGIAALSDYCFPPALYYRANTPIKTSNDELDETVINQSTDWSGVLSTYYVSGARVTNLTSSMALEDPLNFAVGMLAATIKAEKKDLLDNNYHTQITLADGTFPLTGIIIGRQYPQYFDFTPVYDAQASPEPHQYYLYDNLNLDDDPSTCISLTDTQSAEFRTLSLQTPDEKSVYVCLEFLNKSEKTFYGIEEGRIMPDHHFYLVGLLEVPSDGEFRSVFIQDHVTNVNFTIKSLENAYSSIPDMGIPQLSIGVLAQLNWEMATPTEVWLD